MMRRRMGMVAALVLAAGMAQAQVSSPPPAAGGGMGSVGETVSGTGTVIPAGYPVRIQLAATLDSQTARPGQTFAIRLAADLKVGDVVVLPAGTTGVGQIIDAERAELGQPGKLLVAARYLLVDGRRIPLKGWRQHGTGLSSYRVTSLWGKVEHVWTGYPVSMFAGREGEAELAEALPVGRDLGVDPPPPGRPARLLEPLPGGMPHPPPGMGQIIFFRPKTPGLDFFTLDIHPGPISPAALAAAPVAKVGNGRARAVPLPPGAVIFSAYGGDRQDQLRFEIEAGETYYVSTWFQISKKGRGNPVLVHAGREEFAKASPIPEKPRTRRR